MFTAADLATPRVDHAIVRPLRLCKETLAFSNHVFNVLQ
jgi:hypothetical protein